MTHQRTFPSSFVFYNLYRWLVCTIVLWMFSQVALSCTLTMGYRTNERLPLIAESPDNSGLYLDFYSLAAERIGCKLKIIRGPKNRILKLLEAGDIDFYPAFNYNETRARYTYFIENGFPGGEIGVSRADFPDITALSQLDGYTVVQALGSPGFASGLKGVSIYSAPEMTIADAFELLRKKRGDFYIYNRESLLYYLKQEQPQDVKVHPDCCGGIQPIYLGFSRYSSQYSEVPNLSFDGRQPQSVINFPTVIASDCLAFRFQKELMEMKISGITDSIYRQYYH